MSAILSPDGTIAANVLPHIELSLQDAEILRNYKAFLERHKLREALYCQRCWDGHREDGCKAFVRADRILIECRCRTRTFMGMTS